MTKTKLVKVWKVNVSPKSQIFFRSSKDARMVLAASNIMRGRTINMENDNLVIRDDTNNILVSFPWRPYRFIQPVAEIVLRFYKFRAGIIKPVSSHAFTFNTWDMKGSVTINNGKHGSPIIVCSLFVHDEITTLHVPITGDSRRDAEKLISDLRSIHANARTNIV